MSKFIVKKVLKHPECNHIIFFLKRHCSGYINIVKNFQHPLIHINEMYDIELKKFLWLVLVIIILDITLGIILLNLINTVMGFNLGA